MKKHKSKSNDEVTAEETPQAQARADAPSEQARDVEHQKPEAEVDELTRTKQERDKHYEQLQRTLADLQNFRKRRALEMAEIRRAAVEGLTTELLPVLDNFHLATDASSGDDAEADGAKAVREGLAMVRAMLTGVLERHGLREVPAEAGQGFDPTVHEAVGLANDTEVPPGQVAKVIQHGYYLNDRVLRHARVLVAGTASPEETAPDQKADEGRE